MKPRSIAVFFQRYYPTVRTGRFHSNRPATSCGCRRDQEETVLVLSQMLKSERPRDPVHIGNKRGIGLWEGAKLDKVKATAATGIANIQWTTASTHLHRLMAEADALYLNDNPHTRARNTVGPEPTAKTPPNAPAIPQLRIRALGAHLVRLVRDQVAGGSGPNAAYVTYKSCSARFAVRQARSDGVRNRSGVHARILRRGSRGFAYAHHRDFNVREALHREQR